MGHLSAIFDLQVSLHLFKRGFQRAIPCKIRSIPVTKVLHACCPAPNNAHTICATHDPPRFRRRWAMESRNQWPKSPTSMSRFRCTTHDLVTSCNGRYVTEISKPCAPELVRTRYTCNLSPMHVGWFETVIGVLSGGGCLALFFSTLSQSH